MEYPLPTAFGGWCNQVITKTHASHALKPLVSDTSFLPPSTLVDVNTNVDLYTRLYNVLLPTMFGQIFDQTKLSNGLALWKAITNSFDPPFASSLKRDDFVIEWLRDLCMIRLESPLAFYPTFEAVHAKNRTNNAIESSPSGSAELHKNFIKSLGPVFQPICIKWETVTVDQKWLEPTILQRLALVATTYFEQTDYITKHYR